MVIEALVLLPSLSVRFQNSDGVPEEPVAGSDRMTDQPFLLVVNPHGGKRRGLTTLEQIQPVFAAAGAELDVRVTTRSGHALEIARTTDLDGQPNSEIVPRRRVHATVRQSQRVQFLEYIPCDDGSVCSC